MKRGVTLIHAKQFAGEEPGLVAAGTGAHFEDGVALVGLVFGQQEELDLVLELGHALCRASRSSSLASARISASSPSVASDSRSAARLGRACHVSMPSTRGVRDRCTLSTAWRIRRRTDRPGRRAARHAGGRAFSSFESNRRLATTAVLLLADRPRAAGSARRAAPRPVRRLSSRAAAATSFAISSSPMITAARALILSASVAGGERKLPE